MTISLNPTKSVLPIVMENASRTSRTNLQPPPTPQEKAIEAARRRTRELYHITAPTDQLDNWYIDPVQDPHIAPRVQDLYDDRDQTNRQQGALFVANLKLAKSDYNIDTHNEAHHDREITYTRALKLYDTRLEYIQEECIKRLSIWSDWFQERRKPYYRRNDELIAACESTISYMEDDYTKRKVDFVIEVYAALERHDPVQAKAVLDDLGNMCPWLKEEFITRLEHYVVGYDKLKQVR